MEEGKEEEARMLKRSRYILTANRETLARKDAESAAGKVLRRESKLFATPEKRRTGRYLSRYEELIAKNRLFLKIMDLSRVSYVRNPKSHKVLH